jgi:hypothetical protein
MMTHHDFLPFQELEPACFDDLIQHLQLPHVSQFDH